MSAARANGVLHSCVKKEFQKAGPGVKDLGMLSFALLGSDGVCKMGRLLFKEK